MTTAEISCHEAKTAEAKTAVNNRAKRKQAVLDKYPK